MTQSQKVEFTSWAKVLTIIVSITTITWWFNLNLQKIIALNNEKVEQKVLMVENQLRYIDAKVEKNERNIDYFLKKQ